MSKPDIRDFSYSEIIDYFDSIGQKSFRAKQLFEWIYKKDVESFNQCRNIPSEVVSRLSSDFKFQPLKVYKKHVSSDGTVKIVFSLKDGEQIETVVIPAKKRVTVCVSTQAGCKYGCKFCASGIGGLKRSLSVAEILSQVLWAKKHLGVIVGRAAIKSVTNIVFMGVGEPFDNYDSFMKAIRVINAKEGVNVAARRITVSTCGLIEGIKKFSKEGLQVGLAISLHGYDDKSRNVLMPINKKYPMNDLIKASKEYIRMTNRQITYEYVLIKDLTVNEIAARELGKLLKGMICSLNLIPFNEVKEFDFKSVSEKEMLDFQKELKSYGVHSTIRASRGKDVSAACGQLRHKVKREV